MHIKKMMVFIAIIMLLPTATAEMEMGNNNQTIVSVGQSFNYPIFATLDPGEKNSSGAQMNFTCNINSFRCPTEATEGRLYNNTKTTSYFHEGDWNKTQKSIENIFGVIIGNHSTGEREVFAYFSLEARKNGTNQTVGIMDDCLMADIDSQSIPCRTTNLIVCVSSWWDTDCDQTVSRSDYISRLAQRANSYTPPEDMRINPNSNRVEELLGWSQQIGTAINP